MAGKKGICVELGPYEQNILAALAKKKSESKTCIIRRALAIYSVISDRVDRGEHIYVGTDERKAEIISVML